MNESEASAKDMNPFLCLKDKSKQERVEIARKLLKSFELELAEVVADACFSSGAKSEETPNQGNAIANSLEQLKVMSDKQDEENKISSVQRQAMDMSNENKQLVASALKDSLLLHALKRDPTASEPQNCSMKEAHAPTFKADNRVDGHETKRNAQLPFSQKRNSPQSTFMAPNPKNMNPASLSTLSVTPPSDDSDLKFALNGKAGAGMLPPAVAGGTQTVAQSAPLPSGNVAKPPNKDAKKSNGGVPSGAVLTEKDVIEIFLQRPLRAVDPNGLNTFLADSAAKPILLAQQYNVASKTIRDIWNRNTWVKLTRSYWNAEELAASGFGTAEGVVAAQTRRRGRPSGTKDAVPRTRTCKKKERNSESPGADAHGPPAHAPAHALANPAQVPGLNALSASAQLCAPAHQALLHAQSGAMAGMLPQTIVDLAALAAATGNMNNLNNNLGGITFPQVTVDMVAPAQAASARAGSKRPAEAMQTDDTDFQAFVSAAAALASLGSQPALSAKPSSSAATDSNNLKGARGGSGASGGKKQKGGGKEGNLMVGEGVGAGAPRRLSSRASLSNLLC
mmetsp:Transcript_53973/g.110140  ORF Transcript_53973/g.110140 Transcript_53973/m.110140 type:complete len:566 (-) Transcript_53973:157-1854(-)